MSDEPMEACAEYIVHMTPAPILLGLIISILILVAFIATITGYEFFHSRHKS